VFEEYEMFNTDRDIAKGHITISETKWLEELEKLAMEEIIAKYVNYSTMASEENLVKDRDIAVEEIIAKYVNYFTMASEENKVKQPPAHRSPAHGSPAHSSTTHSKSKKIAVKQPQTHSSPAHSSPAKQPTAKFKPPALAQAILMLGLHREDTHGPATGGGARKIQPSKIPRPEAKQTLTEEKPLDSTSTVRADNTSTVRADSTTT
jgi:hypothetical protein